MLRVVQQIAKTENFRSPTEESLLRTLSSVVLRKRVCSAHSLNNILYSYQKRHSQNAYKVLAMPFAYAICFT